MVPSDRFYQHLISGVSSNDNLQDALAKQGIANFTVFVFELVEFDPGMSYLNKVSKLRSVEQQYINKFPKHRLYNPINALKE